MAEQRLDDADIDAVLEQVGGEAVAQRVRSDALVDIRGLRSFDDDAVELTRADRSRGALSGEEPAIGNEDALPSSGAPPVAQEQEQPFGQHGIAVVAAFTALDPQQHPLAVDIADFERRYLGNPQPRAIGDRQGRLCLSERVASSSRFTSAMVSTTGILRTCRVRTSLRARSGRSSVWVKKNLSALTMLFIVGAGTPASCCSNWNCRTSSALAVWGERPSQVANRETSRR